MSEGLQTQVSRSHQLDLQERVMGAQLERVEPFSPPPLSSQ